MFCEKCDSFIGKNEGHFISSDGCVALCQTCGEAYLREDLNFGSDVYVLEDCCSGVRLDDSMSDVETFRLSRRKIGML